MAEASAHGRAKRGADGPFRLTLLLVAALTAARLAALFTTPLELYPDEAQYWAWSRNLAFGYFSKPPLIAWLIHLTTAVGGDGAPWIRLSATLLHAGAALALQRAGARLYDGWTGLWAAVLYSLMPGVQLSAGVIATDAPMLLFLSLALWAYAAWLTEPPGGARAKWAAGLGAAVGLALLSKYAALYFVAGLGLHAAWDGKVRAAWSASSILAAAGAVLILVAPNLAWNATHGFVTFGHLAANTDWASLADEPRQAEPLISFDLRQTPGFVLSQFGVFGPIPFAVLVGGAAALTRRKGLMSPDRALLAFVLPPLIVVLAEAVVARANANWAGAAYAPGSVLVAAWLLRWSARRWLWAAAAMQGAVAAAFLVGVARPEAIDAMGLSNSVKRARGWSQASQAVLDQARATPGLTAIALDDRFLFNAMTYYGRDYFARPGAIPLRMWMRRPHANTQAEVEAPLVASEGRRVLAASLDDVYLDEMQGDFARASPTGPRVIRLDPAHTRKISLFVGEGLSPAPRDPRTGLPIRPASPTTEAWVGKR